MRRATQLMVMGLALAAASACRDSSSSRLLAPLDDASGGKSGQSGPALAPSYTSTGGVTPTTYQGNTSGGGSSSCSALNFGSNGTKVDGAYSQTFAGYKFTVSADKQSVSFAPVAGTTPTTVILAVIVKGGPAYNVYDYSGSFRLSDGGLTSPLNGGGNIPQISHYVVCYGPAPAKPKLTKTIETVYTMANGLMVEDPTWSPGQPIIIPQGETRWVKYRLDYVLPNGVTGTIEDPNSVCATATAGIHCSFDTYGLYSWNVTGSGTLFVSIDLRNDTACGDGSFTNTATLTSGQASTSASHYTKLKLTCGSLTKSIAVVYTMDNGLMVEDPTWSPGQPVIIPQGETRWVQYRIDYVLPNGVSGTITEDPTSVCATASAGIHCSFDTYGIYSWPVTGSGTMYVNIDLRNDTRCGDGTFTNTAGLTAGQLSMSASHSTRLKLTCTP